MLVVYRKRDFSYDLDWLDAFGYLKPAYVELSQAPLTLKGPAVFLHSTNGQNQRLPDWCFRITGKKFIFLGNEFKQIPEKVALANQLEAQIISQLTQEDADTLYQDAVSIPHGMSDYYKASDWDSRPRVIGFRGSDYKKHTDERVNVLSQFRPYDVGGERLDRKQWALFLNQCKGTPSTEAGIQHKCISSRHLEAIACKTVNIMPKGRFNDILSTDHYIEFTTAKESTERLLDEGKEIAERAFEHCLKHHTMRHRVEKLLTLI